MLQTGWYEVGAKQVTEESEQVFFFFLVQYTVYFYFQGGTVV